MKKIIALIVSKTKLAEYFDIVRKALSGWKTHMAGLALAVPALVTILGGIADQGMPYVMELTAKPEYLKMMEGIGLMTLRSGISKLKGEKPQ